MTKTNMRLEELAGRVEAASTNDTELFDEAFAECFPKPERIWVTDNTGSWTEEYETYHARSWLFEEFLGAGAFLDAAMSLVPEGCETFELRRVGDKWSTVLTVTAPGSYHRYFSATPALALTAAALRSRDTGGDDGVR